MCVNRCNINKNKRYGTECLYNNELGFKNYFRIFLSLSFLLLGFILSRIYYLPFPQCPVLLFLTFQNSIFCYKVLLLIIYKTLEALMKTLNTTSRKVNLGFAVVSSLEHHYSLFRLRLSESFPVIYTYINSQRKISNENCREYEDSRKCWIWRAKYTKIVTFMHL